MATYTAAPPIFDDVAGHESPKTSRLRSILPLRGGHGRNLSVDQALSPRGPPPMTPMGFLPADHPHAQPLGERAHNRVATGRQSPSDPASGLHKKTKSSVSLKTLVWDRDKKDAKSNSSEKHIKKPKSAASLSAILKRSQRGRKEEGSCDDKDKENQSPADSLPSPMPSPTWGRFPSPLDEPSGKVFVPAHRRTVEEEVSLYTPRHYSPSRQRNFHDYQPTLARRPNQKPRPKSDYISASTMKVKEMLGHVQRVPSDKRRNHEGDTNDHISADDRVDREQNRTSRVKAAVSVLNAREAANQSNMDRGHIDSEFEKLLDARNIPQNMREKMRSLNTNIKADFIQKDRCENTGSISSGSSFDSAGRRGRNLDARATSARNKDKSSRSRSRGRSFISSIYDGSHSRSPSKNDTSRSHKRPKSFDFGRPYSALLPLASSSTASLHTPVHTDTATDPEDFIHYLKEVQKPEIIDTGKIHKLRLLLRNETVSWVDTFISEGGMDEVIQLLYRIMKVEWREEHEDTLLHETLLCLKALCTTSMALKQLNVVEGELFPALLRMLFDEEKKGPSEYTTRGIIVSLLFTFLSTASPEEMPARASKILSYLRDPAPAKEQIDFIANIYKSRPYRVWCKEITSVSKEVFWIFLHHLNVIPLPSEDETVQEQDYVKKFFPTPRPPVPAAPYVGGVEWDATNYIAAHLDLMNGLIACQPTREQRNALREELRASGFEKVMGGSLRTCKEKFYGAIHDCLRTWVAAAREDGWHYAYVREGPGPDSLAKSPTKCPNRMRIATPPKLDLHIGLENEQAS